MDFLDEILTHYETSSPPAEIAKLAFGEALWPWIGAARKRVKKSHALSDVAFSSIEKSLLERWSRLSSPAFALEMGICKYTGTLQGKTPKARYRDFIKTKLGKNALGDFFAEYHELKKKAAITLELWAAQAIEFQSRIEKDLTELAGFFNHGKPLGKVMALDPSMGDPHNGGRSVYAVTFETGLKLLYKPKCLKIVQAFHGLFDRLNAFGLQPPLKGYQVLPKEGYGWEECVENRECQDRDSVKRYYERAGSLLCLLYLLDGNDVHYENIIASGEHPQLIDMETIFHATLKIQKEEVDRFVLNTGMLPFYMMGAMGMKGVDISGLGSQAGPKFPSTSAKWQRCNTDEMHLVYISAKVQDAKNRVKLEGKKVASKKYAPHIVAGFRKAYALISTHQSSFLEAIEALATHPVRFIMHPTRLYFHILNRLKDPQMLLHPEEAEKEFEALTKFLPKDKEELRGVYEEERRALLQGDIPFFNTYPKKRDLYANDKCVCSGALTESALEKVISRVKGMNEANCRLQELLIRQSFFVKKEMSPKEEVFAKNTEKPALENSEIWNEIFEIAHQLKKQSFPNARGDLNWIDLELDPLVEQYHLQPISDNFYGGKSGIALFFAALAKVSGQKEWKNLSLGALGDARKKICEGEASRLVANLGIGGYAGVGGTAYAFYQIGKLLEEPKLIQESKTLLQCIADKNIAEDEIFDLVGGSAGLILSILCHHDPELMPLASKCADHLCEKAVVINGAKCWSRSGETPLLGLSHGVAGIAYALQKMSSQNSRYQDVAKQALEYERANFCSEEKNWPYLHPKFIGIYPSRWCHGATGIGLARLASPLKDASMEKEIEAAIETTKNKLFEGTNPTMCCTHWGRLEFLLESSQALGDPSIKKEALQALPTIFSLLKKKRKNDFQSPGLMQGQAGVGYSLLRLLDPTLPQALLLR